MLGVVAIEQRYPGHAVQAGMMLAQCGSAIRNGKYIIVVDSDVDPTNLEEVIWAVCTRSEPGSSLNLILHSLASPLDPAVSPGESRSGRLVIDACRPYKRLVDFPRMVEVSKESVQAVSRKWPHLVGSGQK